MPGWNVRRKSLTFPAVDLQVSRGQVVVYIMLVDLFKKALSFPHLQVLGRIIVQHPLRVVCLRWPTKPHTHKKHIKTLPSTFFNASLYLEIQYFLKKKKPACVKCVFFSNAKNWLSLDTRWNKNDPSYFPDTWAPVALGTCLGKHGASWWHRDKAPTMICIMPGLCLTGGLCFMPYPFCLQLISCRLSCTYKKVIKCRETLKKRIWIHLNT